MAKAIPLTVLLLALPLAGLPLGHAVDAPTNLIENPGFELDSDGDGAPDGWTLSGSDGTVVARVPGAAQEGTFALALTRPAVDFAGGSATSSPFALTPGATYRLVGWFAGNGAAHFGVTFDGVASAPSVSVRAPLSAATAAWRNVSAEFVVPFGVTEGRVAIYDGGATASLADNLTLVQVAGTGNVAPGHSFETGSYAGTPDFWTIDCDNGSFTWFNTGAPHGTRSLGFAPAPRSHCAGATGAWAAIEAGQAYELTASHLVITGAASFGVRMLAAADEAGAAPLAEESKAVNSPVRAWGKSTITLCAPEGAAKAQLFLTAPAIGQNVAFDNLSLKAVGPCVTE